MVNIEDQIRQLRRRNSDKHWFVPHGSLKSCLSPAAVRETLANSQIQVAWQDEIASAILKGGRRVFAILILIGREKDVSSFFEKDQSQNRTLDSRIPFSRSDLRVIIPEVSEKFYETQWMFAAPVFAQRLLHRFFDEETILPFVDPKLLGRGAYGKVYDVTIPVGHHEYFEQGQNLREVHVARKVIELEEDQTDEIQPQSRTIIIPNEHLILSLLHHFHHPSIIRVLASFTFNGQHNLLFPIAHGGDLNRLLTSDQRPPDFQNDFTFYSALSGLASAIHRLHTYESSSFNLSLIGYHFDIKPKNILVSGNNLILSDFGISQLKDSDDSKTMFKVGKGAYLAPECENIEDLFQRGIIGRSSDIWSFGCIILEVLVFIQYGATGVAQFSEARRTMVTPDYITRVFFSRGSLHPKVEYWMEKLKDTCKPTTPKALKLVSRILRINPTARLNANAIKLELQILSVDAVYLVVDKAFEDLARHCHSLDISIEQERFHIWGEILTLGVDDVELDHEIVQLFQSDHAVQDIMDILSEMRIHLGSEVPSQHAMLPASFKLREFNDKISRGLDHVLLKRIKARLEIWFLLEYGIQDLTEGCESCPPYFDLGSRAAMKQMYTLTMQKIDGPTKDPTLIRNALQNWVPFQGFTRAEYVQGPGKPKVLVLIEWVVYDASWTGEVGEKLFKRVGSIAEFLLSISNAPILRNLPCRGYFHENSRHAFGLVYDSPCRSDEALLSLHSFLGKTKNVNRRPLLGDIFHLAQTLSITLLEYHKIGWLHKNFSSWNIILTESASQLSGSSVDIKDFHVVGFNYSRPDHQNEYSEGPWGRSKENIMYQHPQYQTKKSRFEARFDYYSLGLVLLELGVWKPLEDMLPKSFQEGHEDSQSNRGTEVSKNERFECSRQYLLRQWVPTLGPRMGRRYRDVVSFCLTDEVVKRRDTEREKHTSSTAHFQLSFESRVIHELAKCIL